MFFKECNQLLKRANRNKHQGEEIGQKKRVKYPLANKKQICRSFILLLRNLFQESQGALQNPLLCTFSPEHWSGKYFTHITFVPQLR